MGHPHQLFAPLRLLARRGLGQGGDPLDHEPDSRNPPVLIVPGWGSPGFRLLPLRRFFIRAGWPEEYVRLIGFARPCGSNWTHAAELEATIDRLTDELGVSTLDVVAHSMGGLAVRCYLKRMADAGQDVPLRRIAFLGTPHRGTRTAYLAWGEGAREMRPRSELLASLPSDPIPHGVRALSVCTPRDFRVLPRGGCHLQAKRVANVSLCCPSHRALPESEEVYRLLHRFFLGARYREAETGPLSSPPFSEGLLRAWP